MKNKAPLLLMEQLVMILVFALASALCLRLFVWSDTASREMERRGKAVILCQNAAETIKGTRDLDDGAAILGALWQEDRWVLPGEDGLLLELTERPAETPGLGQAEIRAIRGDEIVFSLVTGWQEELP